MKWKKHHENKLYVLRFSHGNSLRVPFMKTRYGFEAFDERMNISNDDRIESHIFGEMDIQKEFGLYFIDTTDEIFKLKNGYLFLKNKQEIMFIRQMKEIRSDLTYKKIFDNEIIFHTKNGNDIIDKYKTYINDVEIDKIETEFPQLDISLL